MQRIHSACRPRLFCSSSVRLLQLEHHTTKPPPFPLKKPEAPQSAPHTVSQTKPREDAASRVASRRITSVDQLPTTFGKNQIMEIDPSLRTKMEGIVTNFKAPIRWAVGYGSGVFKQAGYDEKDKPMLDFLFAVSHPDHWHAINMDQNPHHYSLMMRILGAKAVSWMQENTGAGVWFNVGIKAEDRTYKYGVVSIRTLTRDLLDWETMYLAGRLQKPVAILTPSESRIVLAQQVSLASTFRTALLLLPEEFTEIQLWETIAGISYRGDVRMSVGENPAKVHNIGMGMQGKFRVLYGGLIKSFWRSVYILGETPEPASPLSMIRLMRQDKSVGRQVGLVTKLPVNVRNKLWGAMVQKWGGEMGPAPVTGASIQQVELGQTLSEEQKEIAKWEKVVRDPDFVKTLEASIASIVKRPSLTQSLKGLVSAGPGKSLWYAARKVVKRFGS